MARPPLDPPSHFARLISSAMRREMGERMMTVASLARRLGKSPAYARARLRDEFEFTLADVESFCLFIGTDPEVFIGAIERRQLEAGMTSEPVRHVPARSLGDVMADDDGRDDEGHEDGDGEEERVRASRKDYDLVANDSIEERPQETDADYDHS